MKEIITKVEMIAKSKSIYYFVLITNSITLHMESPNKNKYKVGQEIEVKINYKLEKSK